MTTLTKAFGWALTVFGIFAFARSKHRHATGLFPSLIGLVMLALGFASETGEPTATRAAAGVSLLGILIPVQGLYFPGLFKATAPDGKPHPDRQLAQAGTALLCGLYFVFAVISRVTVKRGS